MATKKIKSKSITIPVIGYSDQETKSLKNLPNEIWKDFYVDNLCYYASSLGRIKSGDNVVIWNNGHKICQRKHCSKILRGVLSADGYIRISIAHHKSFFVHRLIAKCFLGESSLEINHKNGNKLDNRVSNIEYCTRNENMLHAINTGLFNMHEINLRRMQLGIFPNPRKISIEKANEIRYLYKTKRFKQKELSKMYNVHKDTISRICRKINAYSND